MTPRGLNRARRGHFSLNLRRGPADWVGVNTQHTSLRVPLAATRALALALAVPLAISIGSCGASAPSAALELEDVVATPPPAPVAPPVCPIEPGPPGAWGAAPAWATAEQVAAMEWINWSRAECGLQAIGMNSALSKAAQSHADYVVANHTTYVAGLSLHAEVPDTAGFSGETWVARASSAGWSGPMLGEVIAYQPLAVASVWQWMDSLYHRLPLLGQSAESLGYGAAHGDGIWIGVVEVGRRKSPPSPRLVAWPPKGATDVPVAWDGYEVPQPAPPPGGYPSGPVLTVQALPGQELHMTAHTLLGPDGAEIPHMALDGTSDALLRDHASIALYANEPLAAGLEYRARVDGTQDGVAFTWEWTFTTRSTDGCSPVAQDCPPGRGCYADKNGARCAWHGPIPEGGTCTWQNDCLPGTACQGGMCRRWCDTDDVDGEVGCSSVCPDAWSPIASALPIGVCDDPKCSPLFGGCSSGSTCVLSFGPTCVIAGSGSAGSACSTPLDCAPGTTCADLSGDGQPTCMTLCDATPLGPGVSGGSELPSCDTACTKGALASMDGSGVGFCLP